MEKRRKKLGTLLVEEQVISKPQLDEALSHQQETGGILGSILVERGFVEVNVLLPLLARHYAGLQFTLADCKISENVIRLLSASVANEFIAMPINANSYEVTLAMANPMNDRAVLALAAHLGRRVKPVFCAKNTILRALAIHYGSVVHKDSAVTKAIHSFPHPPPRYTFETFVVGDANREAYQASETAGDYPGTAHNPLLIYGDVGHGKSHMLCAIGTRCRDRDRAKNVAWLPAAELEREITESIEKNTVRDFRARYQHADVLLLDDIQFLAGRRGVQQEFARLFGILCSQGKQIAVTSDRPIGELDVLIEDIRSQFVMGTEVVVGTTSVALKTAILMAKQKDIAAKLSDDLVAELARDLPDDIRYLEGALRNLSLRLSLSADEPTVEIMRRMLKQMGTLSS